MSGEASFKIHWQPNHAKNVMFRFMVSLNDAFVGVSEFVYPTEGLARQHAQDFVDLMWAGMKLGEGFSKATVKNGEHQIEKS